MRISILFLLCLLAFGAYANESDYRVGYIVGGHRMAAALARQACEIRDVVKTKLGPRLLFFAGAAVAITLFGSELAEMARKRVKGVFRIGKRTELVLAWTGYIGISVGIIVYGLMEYGFRDSVPLAILLAGTIWPFIQVQQGIHDNDKSLRKTGIGRVKMLWFLCLVVIMVYHLLSDKGFGNIKIG